MIVDYRHRDPGVFLHRRRNGGYRALLLGRAHLAPVVPVVGARVAQDREGGRGLVRGELRAAVAGVGDGDAGLGLVGGVAGDGVEGGRLLRVGLVHQVVVEALDLWNEIGFERN